jgi:hypothetical protein
LRKTGSVAWELLTLLEVAWFIFRYDNPKAKLHCKLLRKTTATRSNILSHISFKTKGGITALVATIVLGPRKGRFTNSKGERLDIPRDIPGHSVSLQVMGFLILWVGCKLLFVVSLSFFLQISKILRR